MAEDILDDSFPELKEVENKVGRKTPESLLTWMRDAADSEDESDVADGGDRGAASGGTFADKLSNLKQEMMLLRSADVKILRQLMAVHEGIEAMRWLMEERLTLASRGSSLTGSLSSLVTMEEPSLSPSRENLSPTQDLTETSGEESAHHLLHTEDFHSHQKSDFNILIPESTEARPPSPSSFKSEVSHSTQAGLSQAPSSPINGSVSTESEKSQPQDSDRAPLKDINEGHNTIRRALLRSIKSRKKVKVDDESFPLTKQSGETQAEQRAQDSVTASQNNPTTDEEEKEERTPDREVPLLFFDSQWCWMDSQDDVTFV